MKTLYENIDCELDSLIEEYYRKPKLMVRIIDSDDALLKNEELNIKRKIELEDIINSYSDNDVTNAQIKFYTWASHNPYDEDTINMYTISREQARQLLFHTKQKLLSSMLNQNNMKR